MTDDLVARLLAAIQEREKDETDRLIERHTSWGFDLDEPDDSKDIRATCLNCGTWSVKGLEDAIDPDVVAHVAQCQKTDVLRMCQAHRKIIDRYRNAKDAYQQARHRFNHNTEIQVMATLGAVLRDLAEGYGIESSAGIRNREDR